MFAFFGVFSEKQHKCNICSVDHGKTDWNDLQYEVIMGEDAHVFLKHWRCVPLCFCATLSSCPIAPQEDIENPVCTTNEVRQAEQELCAAAPLKKGEV